MKSNRPEVRVNHNPIMKATRSCKQVVPIDERKKMKASLKTYYVGGDDAS